MSIHQAERKHWPKTSCHNGNLNPFMIISKICSRKMH